MDEVIKKYIVTPFIAVIGVYVVGSAIYACFGIPAIVLLSAVGVARCIPLSCNDVNSGLS